MGDETGTDTLESEIVEEAVTPAEKPDIAAKDGHSEDGTGNGKEAGGQDKSNWEQRYKELQALKDKQLEDMRQKLTDRDSTELKTKLSELESKMNDPAYLVSRYEEMQKKANEEEGLSPEAKEIRRLEKLLNQRVGSIESNQAVSNAKSTYMDLAAEDEFFRENETKIASMISSDASIRQSVLANPDRTYRMLKGLIVAEDKEWEAKQEQKILERHRLKAEEAKKKKTSLTAPGSNGAAPTKNVGTKDISELLTEYNARNKK